MKDSSPQVVGPTNSTRVVYPDAFDGATASVSYRYTRGGISQDVRFQARPPSPSSFGLNPDTTHLLIISEFTNTSQPQITQQSFQGGAETLTDQTLNFGAMTMVQGRAFKAGAHRRNGIPVTKQWLSSDGRQFLIERVGYTRIKSDLLQLPTVATNSSTSVTNASISETKRWVASSITPKHAVTKSPTPKPIQYLASASESRDFVVDWDLVENGGEVYIECGMEAVISGPTYVTHFYAEGKSVIKYMPDQDPPSSLEIDGSVELIANPGPCGSGPVILTDARDSDVGYVCASDQFMRGI